MSSEDDRLLASLLRRARTIAIVGISRDPYKDSHRVAMYLKSVGYGVVPINPYADFILGEKAYRSLIDMPRSIQQLIDLVDVFRPASELPEIVDHLLRIKRRNGKPMTLWTQLGIVDEASAQRAREGGVSVVMDRCIMMEHQRLFKGSTEHQH